MKLDEAIKHCEEVAILNENTCKAKPDSNLKKYKKCAEEHRQLAEWLKDYKRLLDQQPCEDCVSRKQAQTKIELSASRYTLAKERGSMGKVEWSDSLIKVSDAADIIKNLPPVTPKGVTVTDFADKCRECGKQKNGKWITNKHMLLGYTCSCCLTTQISSGRFKYCPNCGAEMRGEDNV